MQMPAVIKRVTWCLDMETLLLRLPSLQGDRAQAAGCPQGADPPTGAGPVPINSPLGPSQGDRVGGSVSMPTEAKGAQLV